MGECSGGQAAKTTHSVLLQALGPGPRSGLTHISTPWTFRAATQQLLASLLTLNLSGSRSCSKTLIPGGVDDLLWWAQSGAETWVLDYVIGVVYELMGMCEQQESYQAAAGVTAAGFKNFVMEVIREVRFHLNMHVEVTLSLRSSSSMISTGLCLASSS